jgi:hypothetical protein
VDELHSNCDPNTSSSSSSIPSISDFPPESDAASIPKPSSFNLGRFFWLLAAAIVGTLAILPYSYTLMKQANPPLVPEALLPAVLVATVVIELLISAAAIAVGLALGPRVGLGRLSTPDSAGGKRTPVSWLWRSVGLPLVIGMALGIVIGVFTAKVELFPAGEQPNLTMPSPAEGLLASIGAGIREEIWLRLGLMTFLVWGGARLARPFSKLESGASAGVVWVGNILAALCFAAIHVPQAMALLGLTVPLLVFIFVGNGVPGLVFGALYWRLGLFAAMLAHFGLDLVLKVFVPLMS